MEKIRSFNERQKAQLTFYSLVSAAKQRPMVYPSAHFLGMRTDGRESQEVSFLTLLRVIEILQLRQVR